jgi:hypothetical protein
LMLRFPKVLVLNSRMIATRRKSLIGRFHNKPAKTSTERFASWGSSAARSFPLNRAWLRSRRALPVSNSPPFYRSPRNALTHCPFKPVATHCLLFAMVCSDTEWLSSVQRRPRALPSLPSSTENVWGCRTSFSARQPFGQEACVQWRDERRRTGKP